MRGSAPLSLCGSVAAPCSSHVSSSAAHALPDSGKELVARLLADREHRGVREAALDRDGVVAFIALDGLADPRLRLTTADPFLQLAAFAKDPLPQQRGSARAYMRDVGHPPDSESLQSLSEVGDLTASVP